MWNVCTGDAGCPHDFWNSGCHHSIKGKSFLPCVNSFKRLRCRWKLDGCCFLQTMLGSSTPLYKTRGHVLQQSLEDEQAPLFPLQITVIPLT